jgi:hypothetical protein
MTESCLMPEPLEFLRLRFLRPTALRSLSCLSCRSRSSAKTSRRNSSGKSSCVSECAQQKMVGKNPYMMWSQHDVPPFVLPAMIGLVCTGRAWAAHESISFLNACSSTQTNSSGIQVRLLIGLLLLLCQTCPDPLPQSGMLS